MTVGEPADPDFDGNSTFSFIVEASDQKASDVAIVTIKVEEEETVLDVSKFRKVINIYPNPARGFINISYTELIQSVEMLDGCGKEILFMSGINMYHYRLSIEDLPSGVYFLIIQDQNSKHIINRVIIKNR